MIFLYFDILLKSVNLSFYIIDTDCQISLEYTLITLM